MHAFCWHWRFLHVPASPCGWNSMGLGAFGSRLPNMSPPAAAEPAALALEPPALDPPRAAAPVGAPRILRGLESPLPHDSAAARPATPDTPMTHRSPVIPTL